MIDIHRVAHAMGAFGTALGGIGTVGALSNGGKYMIYAAGAGFAMSAIGKGLHAYASPSSEEDVGNGNGTTKTVDSSAPTKIITSWFLLAALMLGLGGCATNLAPDGPYKGDMVTYQADLLIPMFPEVTSTFLKWEQANRVNLQKWPEIKKAADYIRANGKQWTASAIAMRQAYSTNPTEDNRTALAKALAVLRTGLTESTKYLSYGPNNNN